MTIKAIRKSKTTATCPDCGKQHRIHRVSQGEYIKGCIYPCCVYWVEDSVTLDKPLLLNTVEMKIALANYILVPNPIITQRDIDLVFVGCQAQREADIKFYG